MGYISAGALVGLLAVVFALYKAFKISKKKPGNKEMKELASAISEGAMAFLKSQYRILAVFVVIVTLLLGYFLSVPTAISFVTGALASVLAGYIGMRVATIANVRTANEARKSLSNALKIAFSSGVVMGLSVVGLGIMGITILFFIFNDTTALFGFSFGASSIALFARVGGGIFTKAADVGADLVGKVERNIPEDDPRNPAVIADNVGDNVGDVAGMGADLFESYVGSIIAAMTLGFIQFGMDGLYLPIVLATVGILASIIGSFFSSVKDKSKIQRALKQGLMIASVLVLISAFFISRIMMPEEAALGVFIAVAGGLLVGIIVGYLTEYYTSAAYKPVKNLAKSSVTGAATNIIDGLALGYKSVLAPILFICGAILISYHFAGLYGIALAGVGMLSTLGISLAVDAYGPVADNAGGIAEMAGLGKEVRARTDALDAAGNTTAAIGKGFAIGSAALTALALLSTYTETASLISINVINPTVIVGLLIGASLPFFFAALTMKAVGRAAMSMIEEVRIQFKTIKGLMQGKAKPDYARCVAISTTSALKEMVVPGLLAVIAPIVVGFGLGVEALGGFLVGALASGILLAISMANSGGAWDNAKKYIEEGFHGGKNSAPHKAAVVGDTVGDPFKDTSGPSLNILVKLMTIVSLVIVPLLL